MKPQKCEWGRSNLLYLGHLIGEGQLAVPERRVKMLRGFAQPCTKKDLRSFLGIIGYYRQFIPKFARWSSELTPHTSSRSPTKVLWSMEMNKALCNLKDSLCSYTVLNIPIENDSFVLQCDASGKSVGSVLSVIRDDVILPVSFFSRQLKKHQKNYSATELEALALVESIVHFAMNLYARKFIVETDHKALLAFHASSKLNRRLKGLRLKLTGYDFEVRYKKGDLNCNADGLSRQS